MAENTAAMQDWRLKEWLEFTGKRQADLVNELGWSRRKASELFNGDQPYKRDSVNDVATWLGVEPFELLMLPADALRYRQFQEAARAMLSEPPAPPKKKERNPRRSAVAAS